MIQAEGIEFFLKNPQLKNSQEAVIANPPFVALETQQTAIRERISMFMANYASGRVDAYLAFLRIGLEMLEPGGYGLFVLPHSFLIANNAGKMRRELAKVCWIHCLADLSAIRVFGDTGSYIILLVFQKKLNIEEEVPPATIIKCQDFVGRALQDALEGRYTESNSYSVYSVGQDAFEQSEWTIVPPTESNVKRRFEKLPTIDNYLYVRQGFISGADDVFIVTEKYIPENEKAIFVPYLPDRKMRVYKVPAEVTHYFFYPYIQGRYIDKNELKTQFPRTWEYLCSHEEKLRNRSSVRKGDLEWWKPVRPRAPEHMMRPKIITPHLVIVPRFSLDSKGKYAVSHSPFLYPKDTSSEEDLLRFFVGVLNSSACYWYIATHSHVYRKGYSMLEVKTLTKTPVPDPSTVSPQIMSSLLRLVDKRMVSSGSTVLQIEKEIDQLVADLYELSSRERRAIGMEA